ncbi:MurR/RpiR family transcriptional regulator [Roseovarius ramblicola]|uniref:MurR/RpiR family transcriptional regulator n=1 Tax=Roseovarius ramblicola TaxID=2022336 RepID=A0ABV5HW17_9RHOB
MNASFEQRLSRNFDGLSDKLRQAGEYVAAHPVDTATRSLRTVAHDSRLAPATFSRLARAIGYQSFEELREEMRQKIGERVNSFAERAERLQNAHEAGESGFFEAHVGACQNNIQTLLRDMDQKLLETAVDRLHAARNVLLLGALGSTGVVEYLAYMAHFCTGNWSMAGRMGASLGAGLADLDARDALVAVTKPPYSTRSIEATQMAAGQQAYVVVITDSHGCPALRHASAGFVVPTDSPHFYSSYVTTMVLVEAMIGMLVSRAGPAARERIARVEISSRRLGETWGG